MKATNNHILRQGMQHNHSGKSVQSSNYRLYTLLLLCLFVSFGHAQETSDFQSWSALELQYKLKKRWNFTLEGQWRLKENLSITDQYFVQLGGEYELLKDFEIGLGLRYIKNNDTRGNIQGFEDHFRWHLDAAYSYDIKRFELKHRIRYQNKDELGISVMEGDDIKHRLRFKTNVAYDFKKWKLDPKFSAEVFNRFEQGQQSEFNKYRLSLGTSYKMKKLGKLGLYYRYEKDFKRTIPETFHIMELKYTYEL